MAHRQTARPTLAAILKQARACGIDIVAERETSVLAGAQSLHDAAQRLDPIAAEEEALPEPAPL